MAEKSKTIKYSFWLTFSRSGSYPRSSRHMPALAVDERAMQCSVELPVSLFTRPQLTANIVVDEILQEPFHIDIEAAENALTEVLGAEVIFTVRSPEGGGSS